jgi:hypothetical protein
MFPKKESVVSTPEYETAQVYIKIRKPLDGPNPAKLTQSNIKKVLYYEKIEHDTYPFKPEFIRFEDYTFILNGPLTCDIYFEENLYYIENKLLDITVWGESREEVEEAFAFCFYSMYVNYYLEQESALSLDAIELKKNLSNVIKNVLNESSQN